MRINKFVAQATGISRRAADTAISEGRVLINGLEPSSGADVSEIDKVTFDTRHITLAAQVQTILLNKPVGYVVSRNGQGSKTVYDLLPRSLHMLKPVGRLDKDSSGLLLLTNDGDLANQLTHPRSQKRKVYEVMIDKPLQPLHRQIISERGINLDDGVSKLGLERKNDGDEQNWLVSMHEGRNRQIRRTFSSLGYSVVRLHRTHFGNYSVDILKNGEYKSVI